MLTKSTRAGAIALTRNRRKLDEMVKFGCLYVQPTTADDDAAVYFWASDAAADHRLESAIESHICEWIREA